MANKMERFKPAANPVALDNAIVISSNARFTMLTDRLIRCEYSSSGKFEDRASQHIWNRNMAGEYTKRIEKDLLIIETNYLKLTYKIDSNDFEGNLSIFQKQTGNTWNYGDPDPDNLLGTARTLDNCDGSYHMQERKKLELSNGLLSPSGRSIIDDSNTLVFDKDHFLHLREGTSETDIYFFGYDNEYKECIKAYYQISGNVPLIPKWVMGIWWSRWESYDQDDVLNNVSEFKRYGVPLSNHVIDMDWHIVKNEYTSGWTGYTWNREYFPNPREMFKKLHAEGVHACLNLHPASGVYPYEERYPEMARHMGIDPASKAPVKFDISDPQFITGYFDILHHPLEEDGVDFWWIDWQQEKTSKLKGLDPLWFLNHLHSLDLKRDGKKRPLTFSRWGDNGSHRYPIGFSGDSYATWETLGFLPYFTATSANIGYGWWSHDVGGFQRGIHNDHELYTRWVQYSVFSPIFRFHNSGDTTINNKPWSKPKEYCDAAIRALKVRNLLIPYIYTHGWKNHMGSTVLCRPMYHDYPKDEEAYYVPDQFMFGDHMIVAPFIKPANPSVGLSRTVVWLPEGGWYNLFNGKYYTEAGFYPLYGDINDMNVFVKAGSTIPMSIDGDDLSLVVFPGNGESLIYSDDGETMDYEKGNYHLFSVSVSIDEKGNGSYKINDIHGNSDIFTNLLIVDKGWSLDAVLNNSKSFNLQWDDKFKYERDYFKFQLNKEDFIKLVSNFRLTGHAIRPIYENYDRIEKSLLNFRPYLVEFSDAQLTCLLETATGCGFTVNKHYNGDDILISWTRESEVDFDVIVSKRLEYSYESELLNEKNNYSVISFDKEFPTWKAYVNYHGLLNYRMFKDDK